MEIFTISRQYVLPTRTLHPHCVRSSPICPVHKLIIPQNSINTFQFTIKCSLEWYFIQSYMSAYIFQGSLPYFFLSIRYVAKDSIQATNCTSHKIDTAAALFSSTRFLGRFHTRNFCTASWPILFTNNSNRSSLSFLLLFSYH